MRNFDANQARLAAGAVDVFQVLGGSCVHSDLVGKLVGELSDEHSQRLAVTSPKLLPKTKALIIEKEKAARGRAVSPDLDLVGALRADELEFVRPALSNRGEWGLFVCGFHIRRR